MKPKISKHTLNDVDIFYSKDFNMESSEDIRKRDFPGLSIEIKGDCFEYVIEQTLNNFPLKTKKIIDLYARKNGLERIAILEAHGSSKNNKWHYSDGENEFLIQNWINKIDGKYKFIVLRACNEEGYEISSKKSIVAFPNQIYSEIDRQEGRVQLELFIPGSGIVDSYIIDDEIERLEMQI